MQLEQVQYGGTPFTAARNDVVEWRLRRVSLPLTIVSTLARFEGTGAPHYLRVPADVAAALGGRQGVWLVVTADGRFTDHLGLRRRGSVFFVSAGEAMRRRCLLEPP